MHLRVISFKLVRLWAANFIDSFESIGLGLMIVEENFTCLHRLCIELLALLIPFSEYKKAFISFLAQYQNLGPSVRATESHYPLLQQLCSPGCWMHSLAVSQLHTMTKSDVFHSLDSSGRTSQHGHRGKLSGLVRMIKGPGIPKTQCRHSHGAHITVLSLMLSES